MNTKLLSRAGVSTALIFAVTRFLQIPIPLGYFNVGNAVIFLTSLLLPMPYAVFAASVGSALADLTSYPAYTLPTLLIKGAMVLLFCFLAGKKPTLRRGAGAAALSGLVPLVLYTAVGAFLFGGFAAGLAQLPGLFLEYAANLLLFLFLFSPVMRLRERLP